MIAGMFCDQTPGVALLENPVPALGASSPQKFGATIVLSDRNRKELRTRAVRDFIIPPYAETTLEQKISMPDKLSAQVVGSSADVTVIPWEDG